MLHASHNLFVQGFFTPITIVNGQSKYFIDEFGAVLPAMTLLVAIYFWTRRKEVEQQPSPLSGKQNDVIPLPTRLAETV